MLTKAEISSQIQKMRRGWEARLHELQREPQQRIDFEEHLGELERSIAEKKRETYGSHDFTSENLITQVVDHRRTKQLRLKKKAVQRCEQQDQAHKRREATEQEKHQKLEEWMNRSEVRKATKSEKERTDKENEKLQGLHLDWLKRIAVVAFAEKLKRMSAQARDEHNYVAQKAHSACVIHKFILRSLSYKRRNKLYLNVIRARIAFTAYVRHAQLGVYHGAMPIISGFLAKHAFHREAPTVTGALSQFRAKVVLIQFWWRGIRNVRRAYVDIWLPAWNGYQAAFGKSDMEKQARKDHQLAQQAEKESKCEGRRASGASSGGRRASVASNHRGNSRKEKASCLAQAQGLLPEYIAKYVLSNYVGDMQRSYRKRVLAWEEELQKDEFRHDLEACGIVGEDASDNDDLASRKPRQIYVDKEELEALVKETLDKWKVGGWKDIRHNRCRLLKRTFTTWRRCKQIVRQLTAKSHAGIGIQEEE